MWHRSHSHHGRATALLRPHTDTWWLHVAANHHNTQVGPARRPRGPTKSSSHSSKHRPAVWFLQVKTKKRAVLFLLYSVRRLLDPESRYGNEPWPLSTDDYIRQFEDSQFIEQQIVTGNTIIYLFSPLHCQQCVGQVCHSPHIFI